MNQLITAFNGGEISPLLAGRTDMQGVARTCRLMRGFIPGIAGGAFRRPPLLHVGQAGDANGARLIPFNFSAGVSYQLEARAGHLHVWLSDASGADNIPAPWTTGQLDGLQSVQSNDVMWLVAPGLPPQELQRQATQWLLAELPWKYPPLRDENLTATTIGASEPAGTTGIVTLTASTPLFHPLHAPHDPADSQRRGGSFWEISHFRETQTDELQVPIIPPAVDEMNFTLLPTAGQGFTIGGIPYVWRAEADVTRAGDVEIDATAMAADDKIKNSRNNAIAAINAEGSHFGIGTAPNPFVKALPATDATTNTPATGRLVFSGTNDGLTKDNNTEINIGGEVYRFDKNLDHSRDVKKGKDLAESIGNLIKAINFNGEAGVHYSGITTANANVSASLDGPNVVLLTALTPGLLANGVHTTVTHSDDGHVAFGAPTLTGGLAVKSYKLKVQARTAGDAGARITVDSSMTTDHWTTGTLTGSHDHQAQTNGIPIRGQWDFTTYGRWSGTVYIEQRNAVGDLNPDDPAGWDVLRKVTCRLDTNRALSGIVEGERVLRIRVEGMVGEESLDVPVPRFLLEAVQSQVHGLVQVTEYISPVQVKAQVIQPLHTLVPGGASPPTPNWREGAFSRYRGFPSTVCLHEQRLVFSGHAGEPQKVWASVTGDFRNFEETGFEDGSWQYQLATQEGNAIRWVASQTGLLIGTAGDEWLMEGGERGITPTNAQAKRQSAYGSEAVPPVLAGSVVLFVERGGRAVREYVFDYQSAGYVAPDLTDIVEHLTREGVRAMALQRAPWQVLWAVTNDGKLLACTYARAAQVVAWAPQPVDGLVESVSVVYGAPGLADEVWIVVKRNGVRYIERFANDHWRRLHAGDTLWHMDAAAVSTDGTGFGHLENQVVRVMAKFPPMEGQPPPVFSEQPEQRVINGKITVPGATDLIAGLKPPPCALQPMVFDIPTDTGTSLARKYHVPEMAVRFYQTRECGYADAPGKPVFELSFRDGDSPTDAPPPLFTGVKSVSCSGSFNTSADTVLTSTGIHPLNILSLIPRVQVYGA